MVSSFLSSSHKKSNLFLSKHLRRYLGVRDSEVEQLASYVLATPYFNREGEYTLPLQALLTETRFDIETLKHMLGTLSKIGFCEYDWETGRMCVPLLAKVHNRLWASHTCAHQERLHGSHTHG